MNDSRPRFTPTLGQALSALCNWHNVLTIAELGVLRGKTTRALLVNCPLLQVFAIDTWEPGDPSLDPGSEVTRRGPEDSGYRSYHDVDMEDAYQGVVAMQPMFPGRLHVFRSTTTRAAQEFPDGLLDAVFIDADHTTTGVKEDIMTWTPKVQYDKGVIIGHDYDFVSVQTALDELLPGWKKQKYCGIWSIERKEVNPSLWT